MPLISSEGLCIDGTFDEAKRVRKYGRTQGVQVLVPRQFFAGKLDEARAAESFLARFRERAPDYMREHAAKHGPGDGLGAHLDYLHGLYRMILFGELAGGVRVKVTLPEPPPA